jgi:hypothetical protein
VHLSGPACPGCGTSWATSATPSAGRGAGSPAPCTGCCLAGPRSPGPSPSPGSTTSCWWSSRMPSARPRRWPPTSPALANTVEDWARSPSAVPAGPARPGDQRPSRPGPRSAVRWLTRHLADAWNLLTRTARRVWNLLDDPAHLAEWLVGAHGGALMPGGPAVTWCRSAGGWSGPPLVRWSSRRRPSRTGSPGSSVGERMGKDHGNLGNRVGPRVARVTSDAIADTHRKLGPHKRRLFMQMQEDFFHLTGEEQKATLGACGSRSPPTRTRTSGSAHVRVPGARVRPVADPAGACHRRERVAGRPGRLINNAMAPGGREDHFESPRGLLDPGTLAGCGHPRSRHPRRGRLLRRPPGPQPQYVRRAERLASRIRAATVGGAGPAQPG